MGEKMTTEMRTVRDPFEGRDVQISDRLVDRLRGIYAMGPHLPNGKPEFGFRQFEAPPIQHEAAARIEALEEQLAALAPPGSVVPTEAEGKPVAWRWRIIGDDVWVHWASEPVVGVTLSDDTEVGRDIEVQPLYASPPSPISREAFQARVHPWMMACFGAEISADRLERCDRFIEEALELVQSTGYDKDRAHQLVEYVYGRDPGNPPQEVGGVMVTLAALCLAFKLDMHEAGETELARIWTKVDAIRAKQAAKPRGSALPIPVSPSPPRDEIVEALRELLDKLRTASCVARPYDPSGTLRDVWQSADRARLALSSMEGKS
jgi:hypothetical protein